MSRNATVRTLVLGVASALVGALAVYFISGSDGSVLQPIAYGVIIGVALALGQNYGRRRRARDAGL